MQIVQTVQTLSVEVGRKARLIPTPFFLESLSASLSFLLSTPITALNTLYSYSDHAHCFSAFDFTSAMSASPSPSAGGEAKQSDQIHFRFCREW